MCNASLVQVSYFVVSLLEYLISHRQAAHFGFAAVFEYGDDRLYSRIVLFQNHEGRYVALGPKSEVFYVSCSSEDAFVGPLAMIAKLGWQPGWFQAVFLHAEIVR